MSARLRSADFLGWSLIAAACAVGAGLAWLAVATGGGAYVLGAALLVLAWVQGRRVRLELSSDLAEEVPDEAATAPAQPQESPGEPEKPPPRQPPYPVQDPLIELMELPGGSFWMGSDKALDPQAYDNELPRREVHIRPFAMARTPVTRGLYRSLVDKTPSRWGAKEGDRDELPANSLSWEDAVRFCNALSERSGRTPCYRQIGTDWECDWDADGFRLPTEAEWEYACRAGTETPWFWGAEVKDAARYAWFTDNSGRKVHPVGERSNEPNPWGLFDMAGNVWEWCWDWYADSYDPKALDSPSGPAKGKWRVLRGGSFHNEPRFLRSADRLRLDPGVRNDNIGFRCVRGSVRQLGH